MKKICPKTVMQKIITGHRFLLVSSAMMLGWLCVAPVSFQQATAQNPGWSPRIIATGQYRDQLKSMPIEQRPYRPLHFYGNSVRRNYYRGMGNGRVVVQQPTGVRSGPVYSVQRPTWSGNSYRGVTGSSQWSSVRQRNTIQYAPVQSYYPPAPIYSKPIYRAPTQHWAGYSW